MSQATRQAVPVQAKGLTLVALSGDPVLLETLQDIAADTHDLRVVSDETELTGPLLGDGAAVALLDGESVVTPVAQLTRRLKSQFPELVLVVAGGAADQSALASQVTDGTVYRFLHKPVSAQRVKLFVEAAMRRHDEEHATTVAGLRAPPPSPPKGAAPNRLPLIAAAALAVLAVGAWWVFRTPAANDDTANSRVASATSAAKKDPRIAAAQAAFERGDFVAPVGRSAADLYREILAKQPDNADAREGLDKVVDQLLTAAERALIEERVDDAAHLVESAKTIAPDHVRVAFLTTQIAKERERELLTQARQAAASGNYSRALAVLGGERNGTQSSSLVVETRRALEQQQLDERVKGFLRLAGERIQRGALIEPAQDNARFYVESARAISPGDPGVRQAQRSLNESLLAQARSAAAASDFGTTERWLQAAEEAGASRNDVAAIRRDMQRTQVNARADNVTRLSRLFNERVQQNRLLEPANDSAKFYFGALRQADAAHPATAAARDALAREMLAEARVALGRADLAAAERWIGEAQDVSGSSADLVAAQKDLATMRERTARANDYVGAGSLERTKYVEPRYPLSARSRGVDGWVELEFVVKTDGSVADVRAMRSQPTGVFDTAAADALSKWRFKPVVRDGAAIEQRARIRIRFDSE